MTDPKLALARIPRERDRAVELTLVRIKRHGGAGCYRSPEEPRNVGCRQPGKQQAEQEDNERQSERR